VNGPLSKFENYSIKLGHLGHGNGNFEKDYQ
jgi:hypothetical protein